jgi:divalent metal cation (Fe/Co/Zn/Cd) transporter
MRQIAKQVADGELRASGSRESAIRTVQLITVIWMCVEFIVAIVTGVRASSVALTAFAGDSAVELLSAVVVLRRFQLGPAAEKIAAKINAVLLYLLAFYIVLTSVLSLVSDGFRPKPSLLGILLLIVAAVIMPFLGAAKKRLAAKSGSGAIRADAVQSNVCAYMSWIALSGLLANATLHLPWADSVAALFLLPLVIQEANEARKGDLCTCH